MKIQILLFPGFEELDVFGPYEVLRIAQDFGASWFVELAATEPVDQIIAAYGTSVVPQALLNLKAPPDILIVPGGGWISRAPQGTWAEVQRGKIPRMIAAMYKKGALVAGVCTGAMLMAAAGILAGHSAITHQRAIEELRNMGIQTAMARVVDQGSIITCGGITSGIDLSLWLTERFVSGEMAERIAAHMAYPRSLDIIRSY